MGKERLQRSDNRAKHCGFSTAAVNVRGSNIYENNDLSQGTSDITTKNELIAIYTSDNDQNYTHETPTLLVQTNRMCFFGRCVDFFGEMKADCSYGSLMACELS